MNDYFNDYLDMVNEIDKELYDNSIKNLLKDIRYKVQYICKIQKKYNINKDTIMNRLGAKKSMKSNNVEETKQDIDIDDNKVLDIDIFNSNSNNSHTQQDGFKTYSNNKVEEGIKRKIENETQNENIPIDSYSKKSLVKKCFVYISKNCHPDKTNDLMKNKIFRYAKHYIKNDDIIKLLYLLSESNIEKIDLNQNEIDIIHSCIENLDRDIDKLKNTVPYVWNKLNEFQKISFITNMKIHK